MELEAALRGRRSIRKFLSRAVPEETIRAVLESARWSPSWANTQSWSVLVVTGEPLERIKSECRAKAESGVPRQLEVTAPVVPWPTQMAERTLRLVDARRSVPGAEAINPIVDSARIFDAPCVLYVAFCDRLQPEYACFDAGVLTHAICLAAHAQGLGTCVSSGAVAYPDVLHERIPSSAGLRFAVGIALGYPDLQAGANLFTRERAPLEEWVFWTK